MMKNDDEIIEGFRKFDDYTTRNYFYSYCHRAYRVLDAKYELSKKSGLDFYSLAHEYYLKLMEHDFKPLTDKPKQMKLSAFMFRGFWFITMAALKAYKKIVDFEKNEPYTTMVYARMSDDEDNVMEEAALAVELHYNDTIMTQLAWKLFVMGYKHKEIGKELGLTPAAISQRYKKMMKEVVEPFIIKFYGYGVLNGEKPAKMPKSPRCHSGYVEWHFRIPDNDADWKLYDNIIQKYTEENRITPDDIDRLKDNEVIVFDSILLEKHIGATARIAQTNGGDKTGKCKGMQGQLYAIPTMQGGVNTIKPYINEFINYASQHPEKHFYVTNLGCGIAGFDPWDIAPLFKDVADLKNVALTKDFWKQII